MTSMFARSKVSSQGRRFLRNAIQKPIEVKAIKKTRFWMKNPFAKKKLLPMGLFQGKKGRVIGVTLGVVAVIGVTTGMYEYYLNQNPAIIYARKLHTLTQDVGKYIPLPQDETPIIATVTDLKQLPKESFFQHAQDGDKIIMYRKNKKAILYRPSTGKVITQATLDFHDVAPTPIALPVVIENATASAVAGASTVAQSSATSAAHAKYLPQGKILIQPQN